MKSRLRNAAKRVRDRARLVPLPTLVAALSALIVLIAAAALSAALVLGSVAAVAVVAVAIGTVTLAVLVAVWIALGRHLRAVRASIERVEVVQRRILAATELQRLEADERHALTPVSSR